MEGARACMHASVGAVYESVAGAGLAEGEGSRAGGNKSSKLPGLGLCLRAWDHAGATFEGGAVY